MKALESDLSNGDSPLRNIRRVMLFIAGVLTLIMLCVVIYPLVSDVLHQQCIWSVLNSTQSKLAFEKYQFEDDIAIFIMSADGGRECRLSGDDDKQDFNPAWSPDGKHIAFMSWYDPQLSGIFVVNSDGTDRRMIIGGEQDFYYGSPAWSPDNKSIVYSKISSDRTSKIYIVSIEDPHQSRLVTDSGFDDNSPAWSPDGNRIAFDMSMDTSSVGDIYVIDIDGSNRHRLTQNGGVEPSWSPNGQQIAFASFSNSANGNPVLFIMDAQGANTHQLTVDADSAAWSADGRQIAFDSGGSIYKVNIDGSDLRLLTKPDDFHVDRQPSWGS
jgi:Tol biopolymer transport system component